MEKESKQNVDHTISESSLFRFNKQLFVKLVVGFFFSLFAIAIVGLILWLNFGNRNDAPSYVIPTVSPTATTAPTPTTIPTPSPTPIPEGKFTVPEVKLINQVPAEGEFVSYLDNGEVVIINIDTGEETIVTDSQNSIGLHAWGADHTLYVSYNTAGLNEHRTSITHGVIQINTNTGEQHVVMPPLNDTRYLHAVDQCGFITFPSVMFIEPSSDGKKVYISQEGIKEYDVESQTLKPIVTLESGFDVDNVIIGRAKSSSSIKAYAACVGGGGSYGRPALSPDGTTMMVTEFYWESGDIRLVDIPSGNTTEVGGNGIGLNNSYYGFTRDGYYIAAEQTNNNDNKYSQSSKISIKDHDGELVEAIGTADNWLFSDIVFDSTSNVAYFFANPNVTLERPEGEELKFDAGIYKLDLDTLVIEQVLQLDEYSNLNTVLLSIDKMKLIYATYTNVRGAYNVMVLDTLSLQTKTLTTLPSGSANFILVR
ncbi:hypothetical protein KC614_03125 [candidate division WWE3 bacterium]|uniref:Uncharacterized protein n=1 Tax=candidate division WWE3 bacterium TaxID=2053526 RepID=A0A955RQZ3_UNCKA|nr:hypothetical protein [candidate division WWE3 bacterium]